MITNIVKKLGKWVNFDPKNCQKSAIFNQIWTHFGPRSSPRVQVRLWTRVPGSQTRVWTLYYILCTICPFDIYETYLIFWTLFYPKLETLIRTWKTHSHIFEVQNLINNCEKIC